MVRKAAAKGAQNGRAKARAKKPKANPKADHEASTSAPQGAAGGTVKVDEPLAALQSQVLSWDYNTMLTDYDLMTWAQKLSASGLPHQKQLKRIPPRGTFADAREYADTFSPLIIEECMVQALEGWYDPDYLLQAAQVAKCNPEGGDEGKFTEVTLTLGKSLRSSIGVREYVDEQVIYSDSDALARNDLVLLSSTDPSQKGWGRKCTYTLAWVTEVPLGKKQATCRVLREGHRTDNQEGTSRQADTSVNMQEELSRKIDPDTESNVSWFVARVCNLSTLARQFEAVQDRKGALTCVPFSKLLLSPGGEEAGPSRMPEEIGQGLRTALAEIHDETQMDALDSVLDGGKVTLVQGPPGTGKTRLLLSIVSVLMHAKLSDRARAHKEVREYDMQDPSQRQERWRLHVRASPWLQKALSPVQATSPTPPPDLQNGPLYTPRNRVVVLPATPRSLRRRILVCAPSNSALDEVVSRVMQKGLLDERGRAWVPSRGQVVRVGLKPHPRVRAVTFEHLTAEELGVGADEGEEGEKVKKMASKDISADERAAIKLKVLKEARVVFSTLSYSGTATLRQIMGGAGVTFDAIVVDEAANAVEPDVLIPLMMGCKKLCLIGDPAQLPAIVLSVRGRHLHFNQSLFQRLQGAGHPVSLLRTQYRMHPEISAFPSREFYDDKLKAAEGLEQQRAQPWHGRPGFGPFTYFDMYTSSKFTPLEKLELRDRGSYVNKDQARFVCAYLGVLFGRHPELKERDDAVGVVATYRPQCELIKKMLGEQLGAEVAAKVEVLSVDGYQGREKDVVIWSTVRTAWGQIGFLVDSKRMNVALTRAKSTLVVVGSASALAAGEDQWESGERRWAKLADYAHERRCLLRVDDEKGYQAYLNDLYDSMTA